MALEGLQHPRQDPGALVHDVVAEEHGERLVADVVTGYSDSVSQALRLLLADIVDTGQVGDGLDPLELLLFSGRGQMLLQLGGPGRSSRPGSPSPGR